MNSCQRWEKNTPYLGFFYLYGGFASTTQKNYLYGAFPSTTQKNYVMVIHVLLLIRCFLTSSWWGSSQPTEDSAVTHIPSSSFRGPWKACVLSNHSNFALLPFYPRGSETNHEIRDPFFLVLPWLMGGVYIFILICLSCTCLRGTKHEVMGSRQQGELSKEHLMFDYHKRVALEGLDLL